MSFTSARICSAWRDVVSEIEMLTRGLESVDGHDPLFDEHHGERVHWVAAARSRRRTGTDARNDLVMNCSCSGVNSFMAPGVRNHVHRVEVRGAHSWEPVCLSGGHAVPDAQSDLPEASSITPM